MEVRFTDYSETTVPCFIPVFSSSDDDYYEDNFDDYEEEFDDGFEEFEEEEDLEDEYQDDLTDEFEDFEEEDEVEDSSFEAEEKPEGAGESFDYDDGVDYDDFDE
jgi:DNA-directed RNA polymerase subunit delta